MIGGGNEKGLRLMVIATNRETGAQRFFDTARECALAFNLSDVEILMSLDGIRTHKDYDFEVVDDGYVEDDEELLDADPDENDIVNHPSHYTNGTIECIDCVEAVAGSYKGSEGFLVGNVVKYLYRANSKNGLEDLEKAFWYLNRLLVERHAKLELEKGKPIEGKVFD